MKWILAVRLGIVLALANRAAAIPQSARAGHHLRGGGVKHIPWVKDPGGFSYLDLGDGPGAPLPHHVVIETPKPASAGLLAIIQNVSASSFLRLPRVMLVTFNSSDGIETSPHGVPVLRSMFQAAIKQFPHAATYTYVNSDIAMDTTFVTTADAVVAAVRKGFVNPRFLAVGRRTNVNWTSSMEINDESSFHSHFSSGRPFRLDAEDYFMVSSTSFDWSAIPPFIVGHRGYDNWLVSYAVLRAQVDLLDVSDTLRAMHMTDKRIGNKESTGRSADGIDYNMRVMGNNSFANASWFCGSVWAAEIATQLGNDDKRVQLVPKGHSCPH